MESKSVNRKFLSGFISCLLMSTAINTAHADTAPVDQQDLQALEIVARMSLEQQVAQRLMMDFRYWCEQETESCSTPVTQLPPKLDLLISQYQIGGVILFSNNITSLQQTSALIQEMQDSVADFSELKLLIGIDQEGGNVFRLPRAEASSFSGNMAIGAASIGRNEADFAHAVGKALAREIKDIGFNVSFSPVVDVNSNPLNPVINVRAFSDSPALVARYGEEMAAGIRSEGISVSLKHFPGHGNTKTDSHVGLPIVDSDLQTAMDIDLYPFETIIANDPPEMIMTAHIQYPALDSSTLVSEKTGETIYTPATLSHSIQYQLLREQLGYKGVVISDALDMKGISDFFDPADAVIKTFQAGVDIALMPINVSNPAAINSFSNLIDTVVNAVKSGEIDPDAFNESLLRVVKLKLSKDLSLATTEALTASDTTPSAILEHILEQQLADRSITLVENKSALPLYLQDKEHIHVLMPWGEQGEALAYELKQLQQQGLIGPKVTISSTRIADTNLEKERKAIRKADIVITGLMSTSPYYTASSLRQTPVQTTLKQADASASFIADTASLLADDGMLDVDLITQVLQEANDQGKKTIYVSLRTPYDLSFFSNKADASLATYSYYGYQDGIQRGPSLLALMRVLVNAVNPSGRLPVEVYDIETNGGLGQLAYPRGYGLSYPSDAFSVELSADQTNTANAKPAQ